MDKNNLDQWRELFRSTGSGVLEVIENAIKVAAVDCHDEFKLRRDEIARAIYAVKPIMESRTESKDSNTNDNHVAKNYGCGDSDKTATGDSYRIQVIEIKKIVDASDDQTNTLLLDSLKRLQSIPMTIEILKATDIGRSVNALRKRASKEVRDLAKVIVRDWRNVVAQWVYSKDEVVDSNTNQANSTKSSIEKNDGKFEKPVNHDTLPKGEQKKDTPPNSDAGQIKPTPPITSDSGPKRPKLVIKYKGQVQGNRKLEKTLGNDTVQNKPMPPRQNKIIKVKNVEMNIKDAEKKLQERKDKKVEMNIKDAEKKLQERYRAIENGLKEAKKNPSRGSARST
ncbi:probable mediator of RNA polymerase II transcription subunit 26b [Andrographis paniculata]|uniref:probable mediator of RNA polymerase II transcription subunit 26b n=1 Tax=Andrographis paniculata TaxID=175694 RepID=UPI0021E84EBD|nr:probable mediator of RNA polymerase II transcription subunit 26b [Andrographis paniculata]